MLLKMFTVYDSKVEAYLQPFYVNATGSAMRSFEDTCNDENHAFNKHPEDYTLFEVGTFDDATCKIETLATPIPLAKAIEVVAATQDHNIHLLKEQAS